ncbi:MAG: DUF1573 domain-containing protein [Desulfobacteraceae bacterium]|nr:DUF1573 domain-containing protein [Desulfobacteraceae bacterium]
MRSFIRGRVFCFLLTALFALTGAQAAVAAKAKPGKTVSPASTGSEQPSIKVSERVYDFGKVQEGAEITHDFLVANAGSATLNIDRVRVG